MGAGEIAIIIAAFIAAVGTVLSAVLQRDIRKQVKSPNGVPTGEMIEHLHNDFYKLRDLVTDHVTNYDVHRKGIA